MILQVAQDGAPPPRLICVKALQSCWKYYIIVPLYNIPRAGMDNLRPYRHVALEPRRDVVIYGALAA